MSASKEKAGPVDPAYIPDPNGTGTLVKVTDLPRTSAAASATPVASAGFITVRTGPAARVTGLPDMNTTAAATPNRGGYTFRVMKANAAPTASPIVHGYAGHRWEFPKAKAAASATPSVPSKMPIVPVKAVRVWDISMAGAAASATPLGKAVMNLPNTIVPGYAVRVADSLPSNAATTAKTIVPGYAVRVAGSTNTIGAPPTTSNVHGCAVPVANTPPTSAAELPTPVDAALQKFLAQLKEPFLKLDARSIQSMAMLKDIYSVVLPLKKMRKNAFQFHVEMIRNQDQLQHMDSKLRDDKCYLFCVAQRLDAEIESQLADHRLHEAIDILFDRTFFAQCSWAGVAGTKIAFGQYVHVLQLLKQVATNHLGIEVDDDYVETCLKRKLKHASERAHIPQEKRTFCKRKRH